MKRNETLRRELRKKEKEARIMPHGSRLISSEDWVGKMSLSRDFDATNNVLSEKSGEWG